MLVLKDLSRSQQSLTAKFKTGVPPLHIDIGHFKNTPLENRCYLCEDGLLENETHFLFLFTGLATTRVTYKGILDLPEALKDRPLEEIFKNKLKIKT